MEVFAGVRFEERQADSRSNALEKVMALLRGGEFQWLRNIRETRRLCGRFSHLMGFHVHAYELRPITRRTLDGIKENSDI
jgi:hypothetical protein